MQLDIINPDANGDWAWKPKRDKAFGKDFKTFHGMLAGGAELSRGVRKCYRADTISSISKPAGEDSQTPCLGMPLPEQPECHTAA